jgi:hypothetical protein
VRIESLKFSRHEAPLQGFRFTYDAVCRYPSVPVSQYIEIFDYKSLYSAFSILIQCNANSNIEQSPIAPPTLKAVY